MIDLTLNILLVEGEDTALRLGDDDVPPLLEDGTQLVVVDGSNSSIHLKLRLNLTPADGASVQILGHDDGLRLLGWEDSEPLVG